MAAGSASLLLGYYDAGCELDCADKVGTGFGGRMLRGLHAVLSRLECSRPDFQRGTLSRSGAHWVEPPLVGQAAFTEGTEDGHLRHPRFQGLRLDKDPAEVVREMPWGGV